MNRSKKKGTAWESQAARFLRERLCQPRIDRRAPGGVRDKGDVYNLFAHGHEGVVECKDYKTWGPADLEKWKMETVAERENAGADFALLFVHDTEHRIGESRFGKNICYMQVRDLACVMGGKVHAGDSALGMWVRVSVEEACQMMMGEG